MSEKNSGAGLPLNWTSVLAFLTLAGGLFLASNRLNTERPNVPAEAHFPAISDQRVDARLWEDPLNWKADQVQERGTNAFQMLRDQIRRRTETGMPAPLLLAVMIHGGPYSEDRESRVRSRFAVISALGEGGYAPEDPNHIGAVEIPWPLTTELKDNWLTNDSASLLVGTNSTGNQLELAFEWYRGGDFNKGGSPAATNRVLVLWLDEEEFQDSPLARLALLLDGLDAGAALTNCALIGPRSSATLRAMLPTYGSSNYDHCGICTNAQAQIRAALKRVAVYCATASAMDEALVAGCSNAPTREPVERVLTNFWFKSFHNFASTDAQLAREAFRELKLRGIDLAHTNKNLAIISEWDTFYGRMLSLTYAAELSVLQNSSSNNMDFIAKYLHYTNAWPMNLNCFNYLRGLDGVTTQQRSSESDDKAERSHPDTLEQLKRLHTDENKAEGQSQFDYLTRLGERIQELQAELKRERRGKIDAIGIVGSDIYDTLAVLQALRGKFPDTIFFTTDLDARLSHAKEQDWARNLLVFSGYGLQLNPDLQRHTPPFRDSGQTAQFAAVRAALGKAGLLVTNISPRRYEISRLGARDLSVETNDFGLHPQRTEFYWSGKSEAGATSALLLGGLFLSLMWLPLVRLTWRRTKFENERSARSQAGEMSADPEIARDLRKLRWRRRRAIWIGGGVALMLFAGLFCLALHDDARLDGEPFAWFSGVSVWPTELLRLTAIVLSVIFVLHSFAELRRAKLEITALYHLKSKRKIRSSVTSFWLLHSMRPNKDRINAAQLWAKYRHLGGFWARFTRTIIVVFIYLLFSASMFFFFEDAPLRPVRGNISSTTDAILLVAQVLAFLFIAFWTIDAVYLCRLFIERLSELPSDYPQATLDYFTEHRGLKTDADEKMREANRKILADWLDVKLIAEMTERVGKLVYYPFIIFFIVLLSRNSWWARWTWPHSLVVVFSLNLLLAAASALILQAAARKARDVALERLRSSVEIAERDGAKDAAVNLAVRSRKLLQEAESVETGAFAPFWENPVLGAFLVPASGTVLLELLDYLFR